jgi:hypothetical protein
VTARFEQFLNGGSACSGMPRPGWPKWIIVQDNRHDTSPLMSQSKRTSIQQLLRAELAHLTTLQPNRRPWQMPFAAGLSCGLPLFAAASIGHIEFGLLATLGGLVFLYLPNTAMSHRMVVLMACAFAMIACYTLGMLTHLLPSLLIPLLTCVAVLVSMVCRFYRLPPPGSVFFILCAVVGAYSPVTPQEMPSRVGLMFAGTLLTALVAFIYSLHALRIRAPEPATQPIADFEYVVVDSVVIGLFVGLSLLLAQALQLQKPYWVPVSCLAVIQGASLRAVWNRQLHRVLGTLVGMLVAWWLFSFPLDAWRIATLITALTFIIEMIVVRHYALAVVFITPLTILLAEAGSLGSMTPDALIQARVIDTLLGCVMGLLGGLCLHSPRVKNPLSQLLGKFIPRRADDEQPL